MSNKRQHVWVSHDVGHMGEQCVENCESEEMDKPATTYGRLRNQNKS